MSSPYGYQLFKLTIMNARNLIGLALLGLIIYGVFKITQLVVSLLYAVSPILLIATLIIDIKVIKDYFAMLGRWLRTNTPVGVIALILSVVLYPFPIAYLFLKAIMKRKVKKYTDEQRRIVEGDLVDFEELESKPMEQKRAYPSDKDFV
jgi:hypothetical protein